MMFLQFFVWGGWFVTLGTFMASNLASSGAQIGLAFGTQSWGAIIAPFIVGLIADRFFNAERILAVLHLVGAALLYGMATADDFSAFYPLVFGYMVLYMPTLALVNSVAFRQIDNPAKDFPAIRVWGTVGWIVAGLAISYIFAWDSQEAIQEGMLRNTFLLSAGASALLGVYSFTLPATPPVTTSGESISLASLVGADAFRMLKDKNFLIFFVASILICIPLAFYYQNANPFLSGVGVENPTGKMTLGQISEVAFMLALPIFLARFGIKITLIAAMLAWALRYALFAFGDADADAGLWMLILGIALHGVCYDFFFVAGQVYTDAKAGPSHRSAAQGMITLATYGAGMLIGFMVAGWASDHYQDADGVIWSHLWLLPCYIALAITLLFAVSFKGDEIENKPTA